MVDAYDFDGDDGFGYEDDWLYVEDDFTLVDELAETQTADPGYAGTNLEIEMESYEYELYEYWDDLEYANDEYWDYGTAQPSADQESHQTGSKRKRHTAIQMHPSKKRTTSSGKPGVQDGPGSSHYPIYFISVQERLRLAKTRPPILKPGKPVSFLADWRERFPEDQDMSIVEMPRDMKRAAESPDEDAPPEEDGVLSDGPPEQGKDGEDEDDARGDVLTSLDPDTLKTILRQRMEEAGLQGVDEGELMETIRKMLSDGDGSDDPAAQLADSLLGQAAEGGGNGFTGWLTQQGITLADGDDETASVATEELPEGGGGSILRRRELHHSTPDSAISVQESTRLSTSKPPKMTNKKVVSDASPKEEVQRVASGQQTSAASIPEQKHTVAKSGSSRKRKAPVPEPEDAVPTVVAQRPSKEPATKRTRNLRTRPGA